MNKKVYIIGGGYSLKDKDLTNLANEDTICVNKSVFFILNCFLSCNNIL